MYKDSWTANDYFKQRDAKIRNTKNDIAEQSPKYHSDKDVSVDLTDYFLHRRDALIRELTYIENELIEAGRISRRITRKKNR